jgi:2,4-dienoyl-CoA reductase-like NADH-dependent reductase (Old Yellow Enzyme family)/NADPH-dependent 2,4-dienoyl-CoA reductase/sulfur reductase-like enzyme
LKVFEFSYREKKMTVHQFEKLLSPGKIGSLILKNRIIMPPMSTTLPNVNGEATPAMADYFRVRARGGAALLFLEVAQTATALDPLKQLPTSLRLDDDGFVPALATVVEAVHDAGAKIGIQLSPGFSSQARIGPWKIGEQYVKEILAVSPSGILHPEVKAPCRALTVEEIEMIVKLFGHGAARAKDAGFDAIEIHAHSGFLIGQFLSPYFNHRTDRYGGSPERRFQFLLELIESARSRIGERFPLTAKFSVDEFLEGGRDVKEGQEVARRLEKAGIDGITVSSGIHGSPRPSIPSMYEPDGIFLPLAQALKEVVSVPIILPGKMGEPSFAQKILEEGKADFIAWGRPLIADPDLPNKVAEGRLDEIRRCLHCNECLRMQWAHRFPVRCTVNPTAGREGQYGEIRRTERKKKIFVIGGGPGGMEFARVAASRGHEVTLFEQSSELGGGQLKLASLPPHKDVLKKVVEYYKVAFAKLNGLKVVLGSHITADEVIESGPDVVVVATGAEGVFPEGVTDAGGNAMTAHQFLSGQKNTGKSIVVVGGGSVGCEVANLLAQQGKTVTVVEMLESIATDIHSMVRVGLREELDRHGVKIITQLKFDSLFAGGVKCIDREAREVKLKADTVIFAVGSRAKNDLVEELGGKVKDLKAIGDAKEPRRIRDAISEGFTTAWDI